VIVHVLPPAANPNVDPQVLVTGNSASLLDAYVRPVALAAPELVSVIVWPELVSPTLTLPKVREVVAAETPGATAGHAPG
jgi:hypothetical protein